MGLAWIIRLLLAAAVLPPASLAQPPLKKVRIAVGTTVLNLSYPWLNLPIALGYWRDEGYDVEVLPVGASLQALQQMVGGNAEFAEVNSGVIVQANVVNGIPVRAVMANGVIDWAVGVQADGPVRDVHDLKGKTIGVFSLATGGTAFLKGYLRQNGMDPDRDVTLVSTGLGAPAVAAGLPLHGPNRWPAAHPWLREAAEAYFDATLALGKRLLRGFAISLGTGPETFVQYTQKPMVQTRLFHYPPQTPADATNAFGVAPHTDYGMITLLTQDPVGGLELQTRGGEWVSAPFIAGTFVVNLGDLMRVWTNDLYTSNLHRVVNRAGRERYSIPTFFNLDYDAPVACLPGLSSPGNPPRHAPIKSGDYLLSRFKTVQKYAPP